MDDSIDDLIRTTERERLQALVAADLDVADKLHADDFQLINPGGGALTKADYLGGIASGAVNYHRWEPEGEIAVRRSGGTAVIRYRALTHISVGGAAVEVLRTWHTDSYERRDGQWQVVWSQATRIQDTAVPSDDRASARTAPPAEDEAQSSVAGGLSMWGRMNAWGYL